MTLREYRSPPHGVLANSSATWRTLTNPHDSRTPNSRRERTRQISRAQNLLAGAGWTYGAQILTVVAQFAYAAITSRAVNANGFGAYSVALSVSALIGLLASGGLGQTVGRFQVLDAPRVRALLVYAVILGSVGGAFLLVTADLWAAIWSTPGSAAPIRWLSISALLAPLLGLVGGLMRRQGRFKLFAVTSLTANLIGMVAGAIAVTSLHTASSLLVSPVLAAAITTAVGCVLNATLLLGRPSFSNAGSDVTFSWNVTAASLLSYVNFNIGKFAVARAMGASALGQWNRADVLSTVPFHQVQTAIIQATYPEFRHDITDARRARVVWTDLLVLVAWVSLPTAAAGAVLIPPLVPVLFGPGWSEAASLTAPLVVVGGLQALSTVLAAAVEAIGRFRWVWASHIMMLTIYATAAGLTIATRQWWPVVCGLIAAMVAQHAFNIAVCSRAGYLDARTLLKHYSIVLIAASAAWGFTFAAVTLARTEAPWSIPAAIGGVVVIASVGWLSRRHLPPYRLARKYLQR